MPLLRSACSFLTCLKSSRDDKHVRITLLYQGNKACYCFIWLHSNLKCQLSRLFRRCRVSEVHTQHEKSFRHEKDLFMTEGQSVRRPKLFLEKALWTIRYNMPFQMVRITITRHLRAYALFFLGMLLRFGNLDPLGHRTDYTFRHEKVLRTFHVVCGLLRLDSIYGTVCSVDILNWNEVIWSNYKLYFPDKAVWFGHACHLVMIWSMSRKNMHFVVKAFS